MHAYLPVRPVRRNTSYGLATFYEGAGNTCQVRWDSFLAVPGTQALFGSALVINAAGNHEIEKARAGPFAQRALP